VNNAIARISGLLAVAVVGTVVTVGFARDLAPALAEIPIPEAARRAILADADRLLAMRLPETLSASGRRQVTDALRGAFVAGYRWGMLVNLAAAAAGVLVGAATIPRRPVSRTQTAEDGEPAPSE
jgi:hypothetical protein